MASLTALVRARRGLLASYDYEHRYRPGSEKLATILAKLRRVDERIDQQETNERIARARKRSDDAFAGGAPRRPNYSTTETYTLGGG